MLILLAQLPILYVSYLRFIPLTQGWFQIWGEHLVQGDLYSKVYCPLPPLGVLITGILPLLSPLTLQLDFTINVLVWVFFTHTIYRISREYFSDLKASLLTILITYVYFSEPHDFISSYFELTLAVTITAYLIVTRSVNRTSKKNILTGVLFIVAIPLIKQSFAVTAILILTYLIFTNLRNIEITKFIIFLFLGLVLITVALLTYLFSFQIFSNINGAAKRPGINVLYENLVIAPLHFIGIYSCILMITATLLQVRFENLTQSDERKLWKIRFKNSLNYNISKKFILGLYLLSMITGLINAALTRYGLGHAAELNLIFLIAFSAVGYMYLQFPGKWQKYMSFFGVIAIGFTIKKLNLLGLLLHDSTFSLWQLTKVIAWPFLWVFVASKTFAAAIVFLKNREISKENLLYMINFSIFLVNSLSGGITIQTTPYVIILFSYSIAKLLPAYKQRVKYIVWKSITIITFTSIIFLSGYQTIINPYTWWALNEAPIQLKAYSVNINNADGFRVNMSSKILLEKINSKLNQIHTLQKQNSNQNSILIGPNIPGAKFLFTQIPTYPLRCPIMWWDVCPDKILNTDFNNLQSKPPKLILWARFPEFVVKGHEMGFRNSVGDSTLRKINDWIQGKIQDGSYRVLVDEPFEAYGVLNDSEKTYIQLLVSS